jgi:hypothetical protein
MNIHQVVENGRHLENLITTQAQEIEKLTETIKDLTKKIDGIHSVVYQLVGGLYCQSTQSGIMDVHLNHLGFEEYKNATTKYDTHPSLYWPTTRQGDENRQRIDKLENTLKTMLEINANCFEEEHLDEKSESS